MKTIRTDRLVPNARIDRPVENETYRILSYGDPDSTGLYKDAVGRTWITAYWISDHKDEVQIMYILPQPHGPTVITKKQKSSGLHVYEMEMQKICNHTFVVYNASYRDWMEFLELKDYIPDFIKDRYFEPNRSFRIVTGSHMIKSEITP